MSQHLMGFRQRSNQNLVPIFVAFGFVLLPIIMIGPARAFALSAPTACAWLVMLYATVRLTLKGLSSENAPLSMTFWVFVYIFFGFVPLVQLNAIETPLSGAYREQELVTAFAVIIAGCIAFDFAATFRRGRPPGFRIFGNSQIDRGRALTLGIVALISAPLLVAGFGGLDQLFLSRDERFRAVLAATGDSDSQVVLQIVSALITTPIFVAFLALLAIYLYQRKSNDPTLKRVSLLTVFVIGLVALVIDNPVSTARFLIGTIVLSLMFYLAPWGKRSTFSVVAFAIALLFIVVFPFADVYRNSLEVEVTGYVRETSFESQIVDKGDYDAFEQTVNVLDYVDHNGLGYGRQLAGTLLFWFPRSVWQRKPVPSGTLIGEYRGTENVNLSLPLWGELYLDGHIALVLVGFLLYGAFAGAVESQYARSRVERPNLSTLFVPVFAAYQFYVLRGSLLTATAYLAPVALCMWFCTKRGQERSAVNLVTGPKVLVSKVRPRLQST